MHVDKMILVRMAELVAGAAALADHLCSKGQTTWVGSRDRRVFSLDSGQPLRDWLETAVTYSRQKGKPVLHKVLEWLPEAAVCRSSYWKHMFLVSIQARLCIR